MSAMTGFAWIGMLAQILVLSTCACGAATTNMPPPYYTVYAGAVGAPLVRQMDILSMPLRENVRGNSTYINTRRYLLGPDNPNFMITPDGSGLGENGKISVEALELQAETSENAAESARCRALARWLASPAGPSPRAQIRAKAEAAVARAAKLPHPRVFATTADFDAFKERAKEDALVKAGIDRALAAADDWIGKPVAIYGLKGYELLDVARLAVRRLLLESFAYRMTGARKYADDATRELKAVCAFPDWNPRHTIDQGEIALAVATAYDWLYDALSAADREEVATALERHALHADVPFAGWTRLQNNWVQVVGSGLTAATVALADRTPRLCAEHLAAIAECLPEAEAVCAPDGVYPEGPGYWNYGTSFNVICIDVMRTAFGHDFGLSEVKGFRETGLYPALVTGPSGDWFNYSDSHGARGSSPSVWWFARRLARFEAITDGEVEAFRKICDGKTKELPRTLPFILFWVGERLAKARRWLPNVWVGQGEMPIGVVSADRSNRIAPYLAIKGGSPSYNHGHADAGSFVLDIQGLRWAFDLGAENYREVEKAIGPSGLWSPEPDSKRWSVFRLGTQGHNTLMIGGKGQDPRGFATLERDGDAIIVDLSSVYPMAKKVTRRVSVDRSLGAHIVDTIEGAVPGTTVRWAMNTDATLAHMPERTVPTMKCTKNVSVIEVSESTTRGAWSEGSAQPPNDWEQPNPGMRQLIYTATVPESGNLTLTVAFTTVNAISVPCDYLWKENDR
ncbi:MAG: heparinase II/III family protein [Kiritimatiellae bacterium]|nr:heparinase II/III family protein [Kiritimatiellia bacterium]